MRHACTSTVTGGIARDGAAVLRLAGSEHSYLHVLRAKGYILDMVMQRGTAWNSPATRSGGGGARPKRIRRNRKRLRGEKHGGMQLLTLNAFVAVARLMELGGGWNRSCDLAGAERGTGWRRRCTALRFDSLHEEDPCDDAVRMEFTALAGVVWFDGSEEFTGARVSVGIKSSPERKISRGRERPGAGVIRGRLYAPLSLHLEGSRHGHGHGGPHACCPCSTEEKGESACKEVPRNFFRNYKEALASIFHTEKCDFPKAKQFQF